MVIENKTYKLVLTALMACLMMLAIFFLRIPIPATTGIIHLGDGFLFLSVLLLGPKYATAASAIGPFTANIIAGLTFWAPGTFVIKGLMATISGVFIQQMTKNTPDMPYSKKMAIWITGMGLAGVWMIAAYYVYGSVLLHGNWYTHLVGIPTDILQVAAGIIMALALSGALNKTAMSKHFTFK